MADTAFTCSIDASVTIGEAAFPFGGQMDHTVATQFKSVAAIADAPAVAAVIPLGDVDPTAIRSVIIRNNVLDGDGTKRIEVGVAASGDWTTPGAFVRIGAIAEGDFAVLPAWLCGVLMWRGVHSGTGAEVPGHVLVAPL